MPNRFPRIVGVNSMPKFRTANDWLPSGLVVGARNVPKMKSKF
jgi:hypothetical protein